MAKSNMLRLAFFSVFVITACGPEQPQTLELSGSTMGTQFSVTLIPDGDPFDRAKLKEEIEVSLEQVEQMMSTYRPNSELSLFNANSTTAWHQVSAEFCHSVAEALTLSEVTGGAFDISVGPLVDLWGFGPGDTVNAPPADDAIVRAMASVGYNNIQVDCEAPALRKAIADLAIDLSAFGKGFAVDRIANHLDAAGFSNYLVEIGGELRLRGRNAAGQKWAIGIESPLPGQRLPITIVNLTNLALATSGDYRNFFVADGKRYSHTIDPRTGRPVTHSLASVTVVAESANRADALATALLVMGPEIAKDFATERNIAALFMVRNDAGVEQKSTPAFDHLLQQN